MPDWSSQEVQRKFKAALLDRYGDTPNQLKSLIASNWPGWVHTVHWDQAAAFAIHEAAEQARSKELSGTLLERIVEQDPHNSAWSEIRDLVSEPRPSERGVDRQRLNGALLELSALRYELELGNEQVRVAYTATFTSQPGWTKDELSQSSDLSAPDFFERAIYKLAAQRVYIDKGNFLLLRFLTRISAAHSADTATKLNEWRGRSLGAFAHEAEHSAILTDLEALFQHLAKQRAEAEQEPPEGEPPEGEPPEEEPPETLEAPEGEAPTEEEPFDLGVLERIIAQDDRLSSGFLVRGAELCRAVGRIELRTASGRVRGYGTGFLVSSRLLMTNNHVLQTRSDARHSAVQFDRVQWGDSAAPLEFALQPDLFFATDKALDYSLVAVQSINADEDRLSDRGWVPLGDQLGSVLVGERVSSIQHPDGGPQQITLRSNRVVDALQDYLHYTTDTKWNASGAPVFNDQWRLAALHHSGVPERDDDGNFMLVDGAVWDGSRGQIHLLSWVANEGVRIERIVAHLEGVQRAALDPRAQRLLDRALYNTPEQESVAASPEEANPVDLQELHTSLFGRVYYSATEDAVAVAAYYAGVSEEFDPAGRYAALNALVANSHDRVLSYTSARHDHLYPWIDRRPDGTLRSVYSDEAMAFEAIMETERAVFEERTHRSLAFFQTEPDEDNRALLLAAMKESLPYNCEHVVPQSWFDRQKTMKTDLHHLFTCEPRCHRFRGDKVYHQFGPEDETIRRDCGQREGDFFEPSTNRGPVARAFLYFLLRYPGEIGESAREQRAGSLDTLLRWHRDEPPTAWERHRNAEIHKVQGNRNPLIDRPEWAEQIDFGPGFA